MEITCYQGRLSDHHVLPQVLGGKQKISLGEFVPVGKMEAEGRQCPGWVHRTCPVARGDSSCPLLWVGQS